MLKHWEVRDGQEIIEVNGAETRLIAQCHAGHAPERGGNARLIAAAPDLLEAVRGLLKAGGRELVKLNVRNRSHFHWMVEAVAAEDAIRKATE